MRRKAQGEAVPSSSNWVMEQTIAYAPGEVLGHDGG